MAAPALLFAGASAALDLIGGFFANMAAGEAAGMAESRARMIRLEAEADATRYAEQARSFSAKQRLAYLKSGVELSGSPLDVLDHDMLTAQENVAAIRASGRARALDQDNAARGSRIAGRSALISSISSGVGRLAGAAYGSSKTEASRAPTNNTPMGAGQRYYASEFGS